LNQPGRDEMVARAAAIATLLRERAAGCEQARVCPRESIEDFFAADLHRMQKPKRFGGYAMGWDVLCETAFALARGCGAQGWVLTIYNDHAQQLGMFDARAQDDVWGADERALLSASFFAGKGSADKVDGGARLSGQWEFLSGVDHASWVFVGAPLENAGYFVYLLPRSAITLIDDWHVVGLAGTGSKSVAVRDAFVPTHRMMNIADTDAGISLDQSGEVAPVYRMPRRAVAGLGLSSIAVGAALGLMDEFARSMKGRKSRGVLIADSQWVQLQTAEAAAALNAAQLSLVTAARGIMQTLGCGERITMVQRATAKRDTAYAAMLARQSADRLFAVAGGHHLHLTNALQRCYRDVLAATAHSALRWELAAPPYGQIALGLEPAPGTW
jgi:3-hydroxy-9,10-secoandrosta-1,3,5(10)-triene-9,17-dione monooxygenase